MKILKSFIAIVALALLLIVESASLSPAAASQQPRVQAPAPDTCEQAMRENAAYRDRIASLERQIDATEETSKTFYLRAAMWEDAYRQSMRLATEYRNELASERDRSYRLERDLRELQARSAARSRRNR